MDRGLAEQASSEPKKPNRTEPNPFALSEHEPTKEANHEADEASSSSGYTSDDSDDDDDEFFQLDPLGLDHTRRADTMRATVEFAHARRRSHPKIQSRCAHRERDPSSVFAREQIHLTDEWSGVASTSPCSVLARETRSLSQRATRLRHGGPTDGYRSHLSRSLRAASNVTRPYSRRRGTSAWRPWTSLRPVGRRQPIRRGSPGEQPTRVQRRRRRRGTFYRERI
ncbi:uncharacterized protein A4U43_C10F4900 [Asparagus officinalis]|uniref:Uncharacterized protein n=1 Tax=Asparagus officinalis TaxID=4686 RepID=A0A5P1E0S8_ASPOF|nr:uncharacterized protein A4U43_C10F4900 [Asparagus officinalis]